MKQQQITLDEVISAFQPTRQCGSCYACCIWLGIDELKKYSGQTCKHLDGSRGSETRCSIYDTRPTACSKYKCAWLQGLGSDKARPDNSGILVTGHHSEPRASIDGDPPPVSVTIIVFDEQKAGQGLLSAIISDLIGMGHSDIKIIMPKTKAILYFYKGKIYGGKLEAHKTYEDLNIQLFEPPLGSYRIADKDQEHELNMELE